MDNASAGPSRRYVARLLALALLIGLLAAADGWYSYRQTTNTAQRTATGFVRLLAEQTERTIQGVDLTLIGLRDALLVATQLPPNDAAFRDAMLHRLERLPFVRALFVVDQDGIVQHSTYAAFSGKSVADRQYFAVHRDGHDSKLHIGRPARSRIDGKWYISFSRRITNPDGSFAGIVAASIEPRYFKHFYKNLSIGEDSAIVLLLKDGALLARIPHRDASIGYYQADNPIIKLAASRESGLAWLTSPIDGSRRLVGYRTLAGGSLIVIAGWSVRSIYLRWRDHIMIVGIGSVLVWGLASWLTLLWLQFRRRMEQEQACLARGQRLELMGRIAGGIAHDLGNTIKIARTTFALLRPSLTAQQDAMALVEDADRSLSSAFEIIDRLLAFARRQELSAQPTNLAELITGFAPILRQATGPSIELDIAITKPLVCLIDPIRLESALLNLVLNSKDAMPDGGRIVIELGDGEPLHRQRKRMPPDLEWAEIAVTDSGQGMSRDVLERAFEPFFTTRAGGSGLGLSQVVGFVEQSDGEIRIDSRAGQGTKVRLLFPVLPNAVAPGAASAVDRPSEGAADVEVDGIAQPARLGGPHRRP
ncbi:MAG TPA: ATP-binding protein [Hyphomicrobiaceae bacterium]|nr:ATP-binding protein [Hyphomicrobiaceae bacterium]